VAKEASSSDAPAGDPYATAKTNLRDNVKWIATVFAAVAGVILAGTPFAGFGALTPSWTLAYVSAVVTLGLTAVCLMAAWWKLFKLLWPDAVFPRYLHKNEPASTSDAQETDEIKAVWKEFHNRKDDLLPGGMKEKSFESLAAIVDEQWEIMGTDNPDDDAAIKDQVARARASWAAYRGVMTVILSYASFYRLKYRVEKAAPGIARLGAASLVLMIVFVSAVSSGKDAKDKPPIVVNCPSQPCPAPPPPGKPEPASKVLDSVFFVFNEAEITGLGYEAINKAKEELRKDLRTAVLLSARTDTRGGDTRNRNLARLRGEAVRDEFVKKGGFAPTRVFISELPKSDLPIITPDQEKNDLNRSVAVVLVRLPDGKDSATAPR
jgi:outer membrane protein OmpA-like peptidoglycan-associated protein